MDNSTLQPLTSSTQNTRWSQSDVVRLNEDTAVTLIPAMLVIGLYMVVGVPGNLLVCYVMGFKLKMNTQNLLIVCLAVFDLLSCLISMPTDIYIMRYLYTFPSQAACKAFRTITTFTSIGSIFTLVVIAVDRYWKICQPVNVQMNLRKVKLSLIVVLLGAAFLSWPIIIIYGFRTIDSGIPGFPGHDCSVSDDLKDTIVPLVYMSILFLVHTTLCVVIIILYSCILFSTKRHRRFMRSTKIPMRGSGLKNKNKHKNSSSGHNHKSAPRYRSGLQEKKTVVPSSSSTHPCNSTGDTHTSVSTHKSGLQGKKTEDLSSSPTHPSNRTDINISFEDDNERNNDTAGASGHEKQFQMVGGQEDHTSMGIRTDSSMGKKQDKHCGEQNNTKDDGYDLTGAQDEDCQEHSNGKRYDYGLRRVEDEGCQEHSNGKRYDYGLRRVEDEGCQEHGKEKCNNHGMGTAEDEVCQELSNGKRDDCGPTSVNDEDCQTYSNGKQNDCGLRSAEDEDCQEHDNEKRNDCGLRSAEDEDRQEHDNEKRNDCGLRSAEDEDRQEHDNGKHNDCGLRSAEDEDRQEHDNGKRNDCGLRSAEDEDRQEHDNGKRNNLVLWNAGDENARKDCNVESSFSKHEIQLANTNPKAVGCGRVSGEKKKPSASCNKSHEFDTKRKVSGHSLVFIYEGQNLENQKSSQASAKIDKTTIIAFLVTLVFILSFLPFLILQIVKLNIEGFDYNLKGPALIFYSICLRSYFINSMSNPFIYGVYNNQFRHEVYILLSRFCLKCKTVCQRAEL